MRLTILTSMLFTIFLIFGHEGITLIFYIIVGSFKVALFDRNQWHGHSDIAT